MNAPRENGNNYENDENAGLPAAFCARMRVQLKTQAAYAAFLASYAAPAERGILVNTLKIPAAEFEKISPFGLEKVAWSENGYYVFEEKTGKHPYHAAGLYYSQEPSAMSVAPLLDARPGERVLDLCAAPGGKSAFLAMAMRGEGLLVSNEINGERAKILSQNLERLGVKNAVVTCASPDFLAARFNGYFDKILVDAPCSGEGMFKKNKEEALSNWSLANVAACAARQREILAAAEKMLAPAGRLVYSTCTFAPEEDEEQTENFLREHPDFTLAAERKLYPHETRGEGHYYAVFTRKSQAPCKAQTAVKAQKSNLTRAEKELVDAFCKKTLVSPPQGELYRAGEYVYALPQNCFCLEKLPVLRAGVRLCRLEKGRAEPAHALALSLKKEDVFRAAPLASSDAQKYLRGETFSAQIADGWCLVTLNGFPLGWGKGTGGTVKNHYPKGLRI